MTKIIKKYTYKAGILALIISMFLIYNFIPAARAGNITNISDTISDSRPNTAANHTIILTSADAVDASDTVKLSFDADFTMGALNVADMDLSGGTSGEQTLGTVAGCSANQWSVATSGQDIILTLCGGSAQLVAQAWTIEIGTNATNGGTGNTQITNAASAEVSTITISGTTFGSDTGVAKVAIINAITVGATVAESLTFAVSASSTPISITGQNVATSTTVTLIGFGSVTAGQFNDACQELTVVTNAADGYSVAVKNSNELTSGSNEIPHTTCDNSCTTASSTAWSTDTNYGFGYCMKDSDSGTAVNAAADSDTLWTTGGHQCDAAAPYFQSFATTTTATVMSASAPAAGDNAAACFRLNVSANQAAGRYTNNMIYIVTPQYD